LFIKVYLNNIFIFFKRNFFRRLRELQTLSRMTIEEIKSGLNIKDEIKSGLNIKDVLAHYGISINKNKHINCPFHEDKTPSMKVYEETNTVYCFSGPSNFKL